MSKYSSGTLGTTGFWYLDNYLDKTRVGIFCLNRGHWRAPLRIKLLSR